MEEMIRKFLEVCSGDGYGYGRGYGYGYGDGSGSGDGDGYGRGRGSGYGDGRGDGSGDLFGVVLNSHKIHNIDGVKTIIYSVHKDCAKGAIVNDDLTLTPCYIVKRQNFFAHGDTIHKAQEAINQKLLQNMPIEERIKAFREKFKSGISYYPIKAFYEWHNTLTGSCEMGRNQFAKEHNVDLNSKMTVKEFILLTENAYGGDIIKMLKPYYFEEDKP